jgi:DNA invertase Pin-like site-specific DNA recombinase
MSTRDSEMLIGYARVSTLDQSYDGQVETLKRAGCVEVYAEKVTGARADRKGLQKALRRIAEGDTLVVCKLDRLARSTLDLLTMLDQVAKQGAMFKSLGEPWCDTSSPHGRLILTILGGLAEFERHLIKQRTGEGRVLAKAKGVRFGRKFKLTEHQKQEVRDRLANGETTVALAKSYGVSHQTIGRCSPYVELAKETGLDPEDFH